jgi:hypothetical protein
MSCALRDMVTMHNMKDFVAHALTVARAFADKAQHLLEDIRAGEHTFGCGSAERYVQRILILSCQLCCQADLRFLKLPRLGVKPLLPGKLSYKAVAKPDHQNDNEVRVSEIRFIFQDVSAAEIPMHQGPRFVDRLALHDV